MLLHRLNQILQVFRGVRIRIGQNLETDETYFTLVSPLEFRSKFRNASAEFLQSDDVKWSIDLKLRPFAPRFLCLVRSSLSRLSTSETLSDSRSPNSKKCSEGSFLTERCSLWYSLGCPSSKLALSVLCHRYTLSVPQQPTLRARDLRAPT